MGRYKFANNGIKQSATLIGRACEQKLVVNRVQIDKSAEVAQRGTAQATAEHFKEFMWLETATS